mgnify:CR=1 FL=1
MKNGKSLRTWVTLLFVISGISALVYQIVWVRMFGLVFGNTTFASSTVLSVFMGGLAAGSYIIGKYVDRKSENIVKVYFLLELCIGVFGALVPVFIKLASAFYTYVFRQFNPSFYEITLLRVIISFLILIIPTTLMGGTLPVLSKLVANNSKGDVGKQVGMLYAANTFGSVVGCFITGYILIGTIGLIWTIALAVILNLFIAFAVLKLGKQLALNMDIPENDDKKGVKPKNTAWRNPIKEAPPSNFQVKAVLIVYAVSGFLSLFLEVAWTRAIVWVMGMDTYAFTSMLTVFLIGLALGSLIYSKILDTRQNPVSILAFIEFLLGLFVIISTVSIKNMYGFRYYLESTIHVNSFAGSLFLYVFISSVIMFVPALLMGMAFPLALKVYMSGKQGVGQSVGIFYSANTMGSVFGSLMAGFLLIPLMGLMKSIVIAGALFLLSAFVLLISASRAKRRTKHRLACVSILAVILVSTLYSPDFTDVLKKGFVEGEKLLYFKDTITGGVEVTESPEAGKSLKIDGIQVASDGLTDLHSHVYPAHLVSLLKDKPENALFIAFGAGGTSGSILKYNQIKNLDVVEICDGVVEPARELFSGMNNNVLDDPRLNLIIQDGRNYVQLTEKTYDIIYSGPIHPQSNQGSAALYTKEFFEDCRKKLNKGGVHCVWLPLSMPPEDYKIIAKTFQEVYPHSTLWMTTNSPDSISHTHLIGSDRELKIDYSYVEKELKEPEIKNDIARMTTVKFTKPYEFIGQLAMGEEKLKEFTSDTHTINTDYRPYAEFYRKIGRKNSIKLDYEANLLTDILKYKENGLRYVVNVPEAEKPELEKQLSNYFRADDFRIKGHVNYLKYMYCAQNELDRYGSASYKYYSEAFKLLPEDMYLKRHLYLP